MSQMEYHIGKLKLLPKLGGETLQEQCKSLYLETNDYPSEEIEDWVDYFLDCNYDNYMVHNNNLYLIFDHVDIDDDNCELKPISDGIYEFHMGFYNGGTCLEECISWELDRLEQNKKE